MAGRLERAPCGENLARHLRRLMDQRGIKSEKALALRAGVAQKTVNNALRGKSSPTVGTIEKLAAAFQRECWELLLPFSAADPATAGALTRLIKNYSTATPPGREYIDRVAEQEAKYGGDGKPK